jgi:hypothetical protein
MIKFVSSNWFAAKSVEQMRVEQSQFEQFTPTRPIEWMKPSTYEFISLNLFTSEGLKTKNRRNCFNLLLNGEIQFGPISCQGVKPPVVQSEWCAGLRLNSNFHKKYLKMKKKIIRNKKKLKKKIFHLSLTTFDWTDPGAYHLGGSSFFKCWIESKL